MRAFLMTICSIEIRGLSVLEGQGEHCVETATICDAHTKLSDGLGSFKRRSSPHLVTLLVKASSLQELQQIVGMEGHKAEKVEAASDKVNGNGKAER